MGADLAPFSAGQARRQQAYSKVARDRQRADVHSEHRLPMAGDSERPAAALDPARLLRSVELRRHSRSHPSRSLCRMPRKSRARGLSHRRDHRQPEREKRRKRGPYDPHGYDAGKKVKGKKRHVLVDTQGLLMHAIVHSADIQDRDGGALLMASLFGAFPFLVKLYAAGGYQGPESQGAMKRILVRLDLEIVKRLGHAKGFVVLPKRWIVERTLA